MLHCKVWKEGKHLALMDFQVNFTGLSGRTSASTSWRFLRRALLKDFFLRAAGEQKQKCHPSVSACSLLCVALLSHLAAPTLGQLDLSRLDGDTVCPPIRNGQDDLPGFDLITQFQLDVIPLKGVRKVDGSTPLQVAYRLDREANFQIPTM
ncbi:hypothetical protein GOODEAATRI_023774 [Goodea atripinnis]|uniref:Uncharacterized protein n=1 Tax=Goodea atripinnis TaxID=208336 RepID=A0ABV0MN65_9TELE